MLQQRVSRALGEIARQSPRTLMLKTRSISSFIIPRHYAPVASCISPARRPYSQEAAAKQEEPAQQQQTGEQQKGAQEAAGQKEDPVKAELEAKKKEVIDLTDRLKRTVAQSRNLQESTRREAAEVRDFALQRFAKDLLDSVDNLDRALETVPQEKLTSENTDLLNLHSGLKMTESILMSTLKKHGLERFDPSVTSDKFDPARHEAVFMAPMKDKEDGTVFHTQSKGFLYNGRVLRPAKVGVTKNS